MPHIENEPRDIQENVSDVESTKYEPSKECDKPINQKHKNIDPTLDLNIPNLNPTQANTIYVQEGVAFDHIFSKYEVEEKRATTVLNVIKPDSIRLGNVVFLQDSIMFKATPFRGVKVPNFSIYYPTNLEVLNTDFNDSFLKTISNSAILNPRIPSLQITSMKNLVMTYTTFSQDIMAKSKALPNINQNYSSSYTPTGNANSGNTIADLPWPKDIHEKVFSLGSELSSGHYQIILVPKKEQFPEFIAINCRDLYRIKKVICRYKTSKKYK